MYVQKRKIDLVPYVEIDGIRSLRDSDLKAIYHRMETDKTADILFFDGSVTGPDDFVFRMKDGTNFLYVIWIDGVCAGIVILNRLDQRTAHFNWCLFSGFWGMEDKADVAANIRDQMMSAKDAAGGYLFDCFLGLMVKTNQRAIRFAIDGGAQIVGEIPNGVWNYKTQKSEAGVLVCYPRPEIEDGG